MSTFGNLIKKKRRIAGLTQSQAAEKMEVSIITIQNWEKGIHKPTKKKCEKLAQIYNLSQKELTDAYFDKVKEEKDNWPYFLYEGGSYMDETNGIVQELHLNHNQIELFGLLCIYCEDFVEKYSEDPETLAQFEFDFKVIPYGFIEKVGSINILNLFSGLKRVLYEVQPRFLLQHLRKYQADEFSICTMDKDQIIAFISKGYQDHSWEEGMDVDPCLPDCNERCHFGENLSETLDNLKSLKAHDNRIFWCEIKDKEKFLGFIEAACIPSEFNPPLMTSIFRLDVEEEYRHNSRKSYEVRDRLDLIDFTMEEIDGGYDVYIIATERGKKLMEWYES